jgi:broad specificity phosphatase PhoE
MAALDQMQDTIEAPEQTAPDDGQQPAGGPALPEASRKKLDSIVVQMQNNKESDASIKAVVEDFKKKYSTATPIRTSPPVAGAGYQPPSARPATDSRVPSPQRPLGEPVTQAAPTGPAADDLTQFRKQMGVKTDEEKHTEEVNNAANRIVASVGDVTPLTKKMLEHKQAEQVEHQKMEAIIKNDPSLMPLPGQFVPITENQVQSFSNDPANLSHIFKEKIKSFREAGDKKAADQLQADLYTMDSQHRATGQPANKSEEDIGLTDTQVIADRRQRLAKGEIQYDPVRQQLTKPEGFFQSLASGWQQASKERDQWDQYAGLGSDQEKMAWLEKQLQRGSPEDITPVPKGMGGVVGQMLGGNAIPMLKAGAVAIVAAPTGEAAAPFLGAALATPEYAHRAFITSMQNNYAKLRAKGLSPDEAYQHADNSATFDAAAAGVQGALQTMAGVKLGVKPLSGGFRAVIEPFVKTEVSNTILAGQLERAKNLMAEHEGMGGEESDNVVPAMASQFGLSVGMGLLTHGPSSLTKTARKTILQGIAKQPDEVINTTIADLIKNSKITSIDGEKVLDEIVAQREEDARIPAHVKNDETRLAIQKKLAKRDELEEQLKTQAKPFHEAIKGRIAQVDEDINGLAASPEAKKEAPPALSESDMLAQARGIVQRGETKGYSAGLLEEAAQKDDPADFRTYLQNVAERAHNPASAEIAQDTWGKDLIELAKKMFPSETVPHSTLETQSITPISDKIQPNDQYRTLDYGEYKGNKESEASRQEIQQNILAGDVPIGKTGETFNAFRDRVITGFKDLLKKAENNTVLVTHSSVMKALETWEEMGRPEKFTPELAKEFAEKYIKQSTKEGEVQTFKGENGDVHAVRHGETEDNKMSEFRADDTQLTDKGQRQAAKAGQELQKKTGGDVPAIIASDLPRALHTANIIHRELTGMKPGIEVHEPVAAAKALRESAGRLRESGDEEGAKKLEESAGKLEQKTTDNAKTIRSDQGQVPEPGHAVGRGKNKGGKDIQRAPEQTPEHGETIQQARQEEPVQISTPEDFEKELTKIFGEEKPVEQAPAPAKAAQPGTPKPTEPLTDQEQYSLKNSYPEYKKQYPAESQDDYNRTRGAAWNKQQALRNRTSLAQSIRNAKQGGKGEVYGGFLGLGVALYDGMLETAAKIIDAGGSIAEAVEAAYQHIKGHIGNLTEAKAKRQIEDHLTGNKETPREQAINLIKQSKLDEPAIRTALERRGFTPDEIDDMMKEAKASADRRAQLQGDPKQLIEQAIAKGKERQQQVIGTPAANKTALGRLKITVKRWFFDAQDNVAATKSIIRKAKGAEEYEIDKQFHASNDLRDYWNKVPTNDQLTFVLGVEAPHLRQNFSPEMKEMAAGYKQRLDRAFEVISKILPNLNFIEDYFPHFWEKPDEVRNVFGSSKAPLEGGKSFAKQRFYDTIIEGYQKGYKLATTNPEELVRVAEMNAWKFKAAHDIFKDMKEHGLLKFSTDKTLPADWRGVDDKLFNRMGAYINKDGDANLAIGQYMMPPDVAKLMNDYLSLGLRGTPFKGIYDVVQKYNNIKNLFQLGAGMFHFTTTGVEANITGMTVGIQKLTTMKVGNMVSGLADIAKSATIVPNLAETLFKGRRAILDYHAGVMTPDVQSLIYVNARISRQKMYTLDSWYNAKKAFGRLRADGDFKQVGPLMWNTLLTVPEAIGKPLMHYWVPALKVGGFLKSLEAETMSRPNMTPEEFQRARERIWDSMDDRMGQVVYDNIFMNKALKDMAFMGVRSFGWTGGTIRAITKGVGEIPLSRQRLFSGKGITQRTAYLMALPMTVGLYGYMYHYMSTGEPPQEMKDYFFPKDGTVNPDGTDHRVTIPSYMKDILAYKQAPATTVVHKLSPFLNDIAEMYMNKDFYGEQIYNPDDPMYQQGLDVLKHQAETMIPFSFKQRPGEDKSLGEQFGTKPGLTQKFGIMPAPKEQERTDTQNKIVQAYVRQIGDKSMTHAEAVQRVSRRQLREYIFNGGNWDDAPDDWKSDANVTDKQKFIQEAKLDPYERYFKSLKKETRAKLFEQMSDEEKDKFRKYVDLKMVDNP